MSAATVSSSPPLAQKRAVAPSKVLHYSTVEASSALDPEHAARNVVDGRGDAGFPWISAPEDATPWLQFKLPGARTARGITFRADPGHPPPRDLVVYYMSADWKWTEIASARAAGNTAHELVIPFDEVIESDMLQVRFGTGDVRLRRVELHEHLAAGDAVGELPAIFLNQSGFNLGAPKRFTLPGAADATPFVVVAANDDATFAGTASADAGALFRGVIRGEIGDFSAFELASASEFVIRVGAQSSDRFRIGPWWLERVTSGPALDFMIESRNRTGNVTVPARGSFGWRDDHHFAFSLTSLVEQYLANPAAYERLPSRVAYVAPRDGAWGALEPWDESAPDIVKLIHWAADNTVTQGLTHELLKGELASFLHAWPALARWLPRQNHDAVLAFALAHWGRADADRVYPHDSTAGHDLFALKTTFGSTKGENPPGHSVLPNILMWDALRREGHAEAGRFRAAARAQVAWMVAHLEWSDPRVTKGQRQSENLALLGLGAFARLDPEGLPPGFDAFIERWADVAIARSANLWDFRRLSEDAWVPFTLGKHVEWNEPGNVAGFPAAAFDAVALLRDPARRARLIEIAHAQFDAVFGRNPTGRHFCHDGPREIEGVKRGWYRFHPAGIGQLRDVPFVLDGAPKNDHYPNHPEVGDVGWTEGWVNFNTAYNRSLAAMAHHHTALTLALDDDHLSVTLRAPLNFDPEREEPVTLELRVLAPGAPARERLRMPVRLVEASPFALDHIGRVATAALGLRPGELVAVGYGYGHRRREVRFTVPSSVPKCAG